MPEILGIVNVTPDSFWSGSRVADSASLLERVGTMLSQGAHAIDIGGCSTRPGSQPVSESQEMERLEWALGTVRAAYPDILLSVDTFRPAVAERCIRQWKAGIVNDVSGGCPEMFSLVARTGVRYVLTWAETVKADVMAEMIGFFRRQTDMMSHMGIDVKDRVILDPGFGFGKTLEQNWTVLANLGQLSELGLTVLAGLSRKSMAYRLLGITPEQSLGATMVMNAAALQGGAGWLRVHDVPEAVQVIRMVQAAKDNK